MSTTAGRIVAEALSLPPHTRAFVVEQLLESLDMSPGSELSAAWREEVRRRCREVDQGVVVLRGADEVFAKAYANLA